MDQLSDTERQIVEDNLGLCGWAVNRWARHLPVDGTGYTQADAVQDAVMGLARAVRLFDPSRGYRLATFAAPHLRSAIQRGMGRSEGVNHRRRSTSGSLTPEHLPSLNLIVDGPEGQGTEMGDLLADRRDHQADMDAAALTVLVERHRAYLCADALDHALLDAILDPDTDWTTSSRTIRAAAERFGYTEVTVRRRLDKLRGRIIDRLALAAA